MRHFLAIIIFSNMLAANPSAPNSSDEVQKIERSLSTSEIQFTKSKELWHKKSITDPLTGNPIETVVAKDVSITYRQTKEQILSSLDQAPALKEYVEKEFPPPPPSGLEGLPFIRASEANALAQKIENLLTKIRRQPLTLDLSIISVPIQDATFSMVSEGGQEVPPAPTNDVLTGIWRGRYSFNLIKDGYKQIRGRLNFIDDSGTTLTCTLIPDGSTESAIPCRLE